MTFPDPPADSPLRWICWACRQLECWRCRTWEGCEHAVVGRVDGVIVLCSAIWEVR